MREEAFYVFASHVAMRWNSEHTRKRVAAVCLLSLFSRIRLVKKGCKDMGRELGEALLSLRGALSENSTSREDAVLSRGPVRS